MSAFIDKFIHRVRTRGNVVGIGFADDPTYHRYFVIPRNRFLNVYLHRFRHSDFEHLHDHRMANISIILKGYYYEQRFVKQPIAGEPLRILARSSLRRCDRCSGVRQPRIGSCWRRSLAAASRFQCGRCLSAFGRRGIGGSGDP
jgi:hypothetical protein